jgi:hypothetical protein
MTARKEEMGGGRDRGARNEMPVHCTTRRSSTATTAVWIDVADACCQDAGGGCVPGEGRRRAPAACGGGRRNCLCCALQATAKAYVESACRNLASDSSIRPGLSSHEKKLSLSWLENLGNGSCSFPFD